MLIKFNQIISKYGIPNGIIHIGAHLMEERDDYIKENINNIIWVEANAKIFSYLKNSNISNQNEYIFNFAICNEDDKNINLNITNNGQSSSILELDQHKIHYPSIFVTETINVKTKRMDTLLSENYFDISKFNFLNLDIQGAELLALKGFGNLLEKVKFIYTEINTNFLYKNCALVNEIDDYLFKFGFERVETFMTPHEWGDALYIKK